MQKLLAIMLLKWVRPETRSTLLSVK